MYNPDFTLGDADLAPDLSTAAEYARTGGRPAMYTPEGNAAVRRAAADVVAMIEKFAATGATIDRDMVVGIFRGAVDALARRPGTEEVTDTEPVVWIDDVCKLVLEALGFATTPHAREF